MVTGYPIASRIRQLHRLLNVVEEIHSTLQEAESLLK